jgi:ABC transporter substrate binding protein (PQQ-dependent alcohol dehydrogenase system)
VAVAIFKRLFALFLVLFTPLAAALAEGPPATAVDPSAPPSLKAHFVYLGKRYPEPAPLSLLDKVLTDEGVQGVRVAIKENNMTGRLIGHQHDISEHVLGNDEDVVAKARELLANGEKLIIADLERADLLAVSDLPEAKDAIILNIRLSDDELRQEQCRANVFHLPPSWAMRADALAQYMSWKKWRRWVLISGQGEKDLQYAAAVRRAANKFGMKIVDEKSYKFDAGSRRTDSGHQQIQTQMPLLTQTSADYDVVFVTDAEEAFGDYLMFRTFDPKPVIGTHGLVAVGWHRSFEQYAGTQMQNRFERLANRAMTERDYYAWLAVRTFGEAVLRTNSNDIGTLKTFMLSKEFAVAGFKGQGLTFRLWDQQLRQPILLSGARALVSISPQDGFLHQHNLTDTMGFDRPESKCRLSS